MISPGAIIALSVVVANLYCRKMAVVLACVASLIPISTFHTQVFLFICTNN